MLTGYLLAGVALLVWGLVVIPVKATRTPGHIGIAVSMPAGVLGLVAAAALFHAGMPGLGDLISVPGLLLVLSGIFQFPVGTICYYEAIRRGNVSEAVPVTRLKTVFVVALAALLAIERLALMPVIASAVGIVGAFILVQRAPAPEGAGRARAQGVMFALLAAVSWAVGDVLMRLALERFHPVAATLLSLTFGAAVYLAIAGIKGILPQVLRMPRRDGCLYAVHGIMSFCVGYLAFYASMKMIGVVSASIITSTWPAVSFVVGVTWYREGISLRKLVGFVLLMGSVFLLVAGR